METRQERREKRKNNRRKMRVSGRGTKDLSQFVYGKKLPTKINKNEADDQTNTKAV